jgi:hypothetical protein
MNTTYVAKGRHISLSERFSNLLKAEELFAFLKRGEWENGQGGQDFAGENRIHSKKVACPLVRSAHMSLLCGWKNCNTAFKKGKRKLRE